CRVSPGGVATFVTGFLLCELGRRAGWKVHGGFAGAGFRFGARTTELAGFIQGDVLNKFKARLRSGKACVNAWLAIPSGFSAEVMAQCGFDSVTVDMQHGVQDYLSMIQCFQAMDRHPITPLVRVPWNEPGIIGKVLDGG